MQHYLDNNKNNINFARSKNKERDDNAICDYDKKKLKESVLKKFMLKFYRNFVKYT